MGVCAPRVARQPARAARAAGTRSPHRVRGAMGASWAGRVHGVIRVGVEPTGSMTQYCATVMRGSDCVGEPTGSTTDGVNSDPSQLGLRVECVQAVVGGCRGEGGGGGPPPLLLFPSPPPPLLDRLSFPPPLREKAEGALARGVSPPPVRDDPIAATL